MRFLKTLLLVPFFFLTACNNDNDDITDTCLSDDQLAYGYTSEDGTEIRIYDNGEAYVLEEGRCSLVAQYFVPGFFEATYVETDTGICIRVDETTFFKPFLAHEETFEGYANFRELIIEDATQTDRLFTNFTMQSPSAKTVNEYVDLQNCILNETCDFIDNRFGIGVDPGDESNPVLEFYSVTPSSDMVTSKSSLVSTLLYFEQGDDFWFEAKYYIDGPLPTTIADFESSYFLESPGPRLIFRGEYLAVENKFGDKITYNQPDATKVAFPTNEWVTVKVHLQYDTSNGIIQVWQNDQLIIDESGRNMPLDIWIQNRVEIGITATSAETTLYLDDLKFSNEEF